MEFQVTGNVLVDCDCRAIKISGYVKMLLKIFSNHY